MDHLVYLVYGEAAYFDEAIYSVLSARQMARAQNEHWRIIVYTDDTDKVRDLRAEFETVDSATLRQWAGPRAFRHRRKICVLQHALRKRGGRAVLCDTDTYFIKSPAELFSRIRPGRSVMQACEGRIQVAALPSLTAALTTDNLTTVAGRRWKLSANTLIFNSGLVGLHEADVGLLDEALHLNDQLVRHGRIHTIEQAAFSISLNHHTRLQEAYDVVGHYWLKPQRAVFQQQLHAVLHDPSIASDEERLRRLLPHRPPPTPVRYPLAPKERLRFALQRIAHRIGFG